MAYFDTIEPVLEITRSRINDAMNGIQGDVLTNENPITTVTLNGGWRRLQDRLCALGFTVLEKEVILIVPALPNGGLAPGVQQWIDWTGCFDGVAFATTPTQLPSDLIQPRACSEIPHDLATDPAQMFAEMDEIQGMLPAIPKGDFLNDWQWRQNRLYLIGAKVSNYIRIRYASYFPDFTSLAADTTNNKGTAQLIPISRAYNALSWYWCAEVSAPRGDVDYATFVSNAEAAVDQMFKRDSDEPMPPSDKAREGQRAA